MQRRTTQPPFTARISRTFTLVLGALVVVLVLVGGTSLALAIRISRNYDAVEREYEHVTKLEEVHGLFHDIVFELHQAEPTSAAARTPHALSLLAEYARELDALEKLHLAELPADHTGTQKALLHDLRRLGSEMRTLAERMAATGRFSERDIEWLDGAVQLVPRTVHELESLHQSQIARLLGISQGLVRTATVLCVAFIVLGGALVAFAGVIAHRGLGVPLRGLSDAALGIAEGRFDARVPVRSSNEIGQLSHAFNVMADCLEAHERELRLTHDALERKVRETQALYRLGTDVARLQLVEPVLQAIVDGTRGMLDGGVAVAVCLFGQGERRVAAYATSGPAEAFEPAASSAPAQTEPAAGAGAAGLPSCPLLRPEYARTQIAAPLRLADEDIGAIWASRPDEREFDKAEVELLGGVATQAAIAVERIRLAQEVRTLAAVEERDRIAREMHDGLAQALGLLHVRLHVALAHATDAPRVEAALREMTRITEAAYEDVRQSIFELRTCVSRGLGLVPTLAEYLHDYSAQNGIAVELDVSGGTLAPLPLACEVQAIRIIQEALANVRKHARARHAWVRLQQEGPSVRVAVEDDGVGWDRATPSGRLHFGLQTMHERAEAVGGRLEIDSAPGAGTRVVATLPARFS